MSKHLKKIEEELLPEMEIAAIKGNMNRVIAALRESIAALVEDAKATNVGLDSLITKARKTTKLKKPAPKKPSAKKAITGTVEQGNG